MSEAYAQVELRVQEAVNTCRTQLSNQLKPNIAEVARNHRVPEQRLRARLKGRPDKTTVGGRNKALSDAQELAVCDYLDLLDKGSHKARYFMPTKCANSILAEAHPTEKRPPTVSQHWSRRFLERHPQYNLRKQKTKA